VFCRHFDEDFFAVRVFLVINRILLICNYGYYQSPRLRAGGDLQVTVIRQMALQSTTRCAEHYTDGRTATQPPQAARGKRRKARWGHMYVRLMT